MTDIFITRRIFEEAINFLHGEGFTLDVNNTGRILDPAEIKERASGARGLICLLNDRVDADLMDACPSLVVVANVAVGYDNIDVAAASRRNIMVTNTPGVLTETTADLAFALLMCAARRLAEADRYTRAGLFDGWELMQPHTGVDVHEKVLGLVGFGRIGKAVARRGRLGFGMKILYHDRKKDPVSEKELGAEFAELDDLLRKSDFISIHVPLTDDTRHLISGNEFDLMKEGAILINTSRGPVVDEEALVEALKENRIRGAALDVFEEEPKVHPGLKETEKWVVLAPHLGSASLETRTKMAMMAAENVVAALRKERPANLINPEILE